MSVKKKISLNRFREKSTQVLKLVNQRKFEVIVYDSDGPVARLFPYNDNPMPSTLKTIEPSRASQSSPTDLGGVWNIGDNTRRKLKKRKGSWRQRWLSLGGAWKVARVSAIISFIPKI